ncbi:MAG: hypothetical protein JNM27_02235 [Leptospirales bacterium]|nr:hypothetical protein [Leptospirales bacterium]
MIGLPMSYSLSAILIMLACTVGLFAAPNESDEKLSGNTIGLQLQFWTGTQSDFYKSDLETRFFQDDLLRGQNSTTQPLAAAQWNNRWLNKPQFNLPVRAYYSPYFLPQLYFDASYFRVRGTITHFGLSDLPAPERTHINELSGYERTSTTAGAAYNFMGYFRNDATSLLALRAGFVREKLGFNYKPLAFSTSGVAVSLLDNPFQASASGLYGGIELTLPVLKRWSVTTRIDRSESLRGRMKAERTVFQPASSGMQATYDRSEASYRLTRTDKLFALNFYAIVDFKVTIGYREMVYNVSYPGYTSYSISNSGGAIQIFPTSEVILDYFIYQESRREKMGNTMVGLEKIFYL